MQIDQFTMTDEVLISPDVGVNLQNEVFNVEVKMLKIKSFITFTMLVVWQ